MDPASPSSAKAVSPTTSSPTTLNYNPLAFPDPAKEDPWTKEVAIDRRKNPTEEEETVFFYDEKVEI